MSAVWMFCWLQMVINVSLIFQVWRLTRRSQSSVNHTHPVEMIGGDAGLVLQTDEALTDESAEAMRDRYRDQYRSASDG